MEATLVEPQLRRGGLDRFPVVAMAVWAAAHALLLRAVGSSPAYGFFAWDAGWYRRIMDRGYFATPAGAPRPTNFFPLLPLLGRAVATVVGSPTVAAGAVAWAAALVAVVLVHRLVAEWRGVRVARATVVVLLAFPMSFFLWQFMTEGLFVALSAGAFLAQERERRTAAGVLGALAAATRPPGVLIVVALLARHRQRRGGSRSALPLLLPVLGLGTVMIAQWLATSNPVDFVSAGAAWGRQLSFPWTPVLHGLTQLGRPEHPELPHLALAVDVASALGVPLLGLVAVRRRWPASAVVWILAMGLLPLFSGFIASVGRYALGAWPAAAVFGEITTRWPRAVRVVTLVGASLVTLGVVSQWSRGCFVG